MLRLFLPGERETRRYLRELTSMESWSKADLDAWQLAKAQQMVAYAYESVPYYRKRYQREDIHPEDIKSWEDFQALPFLTKDDVRENLDDLTSRDFDKKMYPNETGGSTGRPIHFFREASWWHWNVALETRSRGWYGVQPGDKEAWVWGAPRDMPDWSLKKRWRAHLKQRRYLNAFALTEPKMREFADMLIRWKPAMFKAYASAIALFAQFLKDEHITGIRPKLIETTAEKLTRPQCELLEEVFECPVAEQYNSREFATIGYQCEHGGVHIAETRYLEIIANGQVVLPGQLGEVAITSLTQFAMPFIRYKIEDLAIYDEEKCVCGRAMPVLKEIVGRTHDYLVTADNQFVHGEFFAYTFRVKPEVVRYQIYQPDRYHVTVRLVCREAVSDAWLEAVLQKVQARFGDTMQVSVQVVDHIDLTPAGKHRFIVSEVKPDFV